MEKVAYFLGELTLSPWCFRVNILAFKGKINLIYLSYYKWCYCGPYNTVQNVRANRLSCKAWQAVVRLHCPGLQSCGQEESTKSAGWENLELTAEHWTHTWNEMHPCHGRHSKNCCLRGIRLTMIHLMDNWCWIIQRQFPRGPVTLGTENSWVWGVEVFLELAIWKGIFFLMAL